MKQTLHSITQKKLAGHPITMATAYDFPTARMLDEAGIDSVLVGDSVGTNYLGYASEREVTMQDMAHHTKAVRRAVKNAFLIADLPYGCTDSGDDAAACAKELVDCGAECVKIEGWGEKADIVKHLVDNGFTVCAHTGYNPQAHDKPQVFGRDQHQAQDLLNGAKALCDAGAKMIVLEMLPRALAREITKELPIPTIGIGSGNACDGQVLVINDILGLSPKVFKHARAFADVRGAMMGAFKGYIDAVVTREFPGAENSW